MSNNTEINKDASEVNNVEKEEQIVLPSKSEQATPSVDKQVDSIALEQTIATKDAGQLASVATEEHSVNDATPQKKKKASSKTLIGAAIASMVLIFGASGYVLLKDKNAANQKVEKAKNTTVAVKENIIYKSTLDAKEFSEEELFEATYPFTKTAIGNTKQYSRSLFEKIDSIIVDPTGEVFPSNSSLLQTFANATYGFASINVDVNALPKQPLFIRLVTEKEHTPFAVRHFYMSGDATDRIVSFEGLSGGKYYFQILNLITQTPYVSNTFNLTSNGVITGSTTISFSKINEIDHIFRLPLEDETSTLLVEDIPIVLNADINREVLDFSRVRAIKEASEETN